MAIFIHVLEGILFLLIGLFVNRVLRQFANQETEESHRIAKEQNVSLGDAQTEQKIDVVHEPLEKRFSDKAQEYKVKMRTASSLLNDQDKTLERAHIFALSQLDEIDQKIAPSSSESLSPMEAAVSCYLIGAVDFIGRQAEFCAKSRFQLIQEVLVSNLPVVGEYTKSRFDEVHRDAHTDDNMHMTRAGAKAAKLWINGRDVPEEFSLNEQLNSWQEFAVA